MMDDKGYPSTPAARRKARRFVLQGLYQWQISATSPTEIEAHFLAVNDMKKVDLGYFSALLRGVVDGCEKLDAAIAPCLDRKLSEVSQVEKAILRLGTYELMERIDVPYRVVINEGIELAKVFGAEESYRYVNGVLDKLARQLRHNEQRAGS